MSNQEPLILFLAASLFLLGAFLLARPLLVIRRARHSRHWPRVTGVVVSRRAVPVLDYTRELSLLRARFVPQVAYRYHVHGRDYLSTHIHFGRATAVVKEAADAAYPAYRPGEEVAVYFDPQDPGVAVLEPGVCRVDHVSLIAGLGVLVAGLWLLALYLM